MHRLRAAMSVSLLFVAACALPRPEAQADQVAADTSAKQARANTHKKEAEPAPLSPQAATDARADGSSLAAASGPAAPAVETYGAGGLGLRGSAPLGAAGETGSLGTGRVSTKGRGSGIAGFTSTPGERDFAMAQGLGGYLPPPQASLPTHRPAPEKIAHEPSSQPEHPANSSGHLVASGINPLVSAKDDRLSTFAADVDTASYTFAKRSLRSGARPPVAAVRAEEWINAFAYEYDDTADKAPFSIHLDGAKLAQGSHLVRVGIQARRVDHAERDPVHLTFLVDVSGSMSAADRLGLAKESLSLLVRQLDERDDVAIVTYAGATSVVLPSTSATPKNRDRILSAIDSLHSGGGTNMGSGMELAYQEAHKALAEKGISRVIVLSDGDANIGRISFDQIMKSIKGYVSEGVTMSTVGFGTGNYNDHLMEQLANAGNGNYSYVANMDDARRIFVDGLTGTLQVVAKDVKIQVEMNPDVVNEYRLIGYENRDVADKDFRNDKVDAGEIGAGHTVTALYEVRLKDDASAKDLATVRVRWKSPHGVKANEVERALTSSMVRGTMDDLSRDARMASAAMIAAEALRGSPHVSRLGLTLADAVRLARGAAQGPFAAERREFSELLAPFVGSANVALRGTP